MATQIDKQIQQALTGFDSASQAISAATKRRINQQYEHDLGGTQQSAINRGIGNTTILNSLQDQDKRRRNDALLDADARSLQFQAGMLPTISSLVSQAAAAPLASQQGGEGAKNRSLTWSPATSASMGSFGDSGPISSALGFQPSSSTAGSGGTGGASAYDAYQAEIKKLRSGSFPLITDSMYRALNAKYTGNPNTPPTQGGNTVLMGNGGYATSNGYTPGDVIITKDGMKSADGKISITKSK